MTFEDLYLGADDGLEPSDDTMPDHPYEEELDESAVEALIESGRSEYRDAWHEYVSEFN